MVWVAPPNSPANLACLSFIETLPASGENFTIIVNLLRLWQLLIYKPFFLSESLSMTREIGCIGGIIYRQNTNKRTQ